MRHPIFHSPIPTKYAKIKPLDMLVANIVRYWETYGTYAPTGANKRSTSTEVGYTVS